MAEVEVSVVVAVSAADYRLLPRQLDALRRQVTNRSFEVVVSDNSGSLGRVDDVTVIDSSTTRGAAFARNCGVESARGQKILFCDADDIVCDEWVEAHAEALDATSYSAGAFVWVTEGDDTDQLVMAGDWPDSTRFTTEHRFHESIPYANTANAGICRDVFIRSGGFPTNYIRAQDVALGLAVHRLGITPAFVPAAQVVKYWTGNDGRAAVRRAYESGRSIARLQSDFAVGPRPLGLIGRHVRRTLAAIRRLDAVMALRQFVQLWGTVVGFALGWRPLFRLRRRD